MPEIRLVPAILCVALQDRKQSPSIIDMLWRLILKQKLEHGIAQLLVHDRGFKDWPLPDHKLYHPVDEAELGPVCWNNNLDNSNL